MTGRISEIFQSIQGEGKYIGSRQVFVRFFGCDLHCSWCDTPASKDAGQNNFEELDVPQLFSRILGLWKDCHSVSLTGGEPLLQTAFLKELLVELKKNKMKSYLETNGILFKELQSIILDLDIISMDIKLPSSTKCRSFWFEHEQFLKIAVQKEVFIKSVISGETTREDIELAKSLIKKIDKGVLWVLQPNAFEPGEDLINKCIEYQSICLKELCNVRIIPQIQRILNVR